MKHSKYSFYKDCAEKWQEVEDWALKQFRQGLELRKGTKLEKWDKIFLKRFRKINKAKWHALVDK